MKITRGSIQSSRKSNATHNSDKRLNYGNERYNGYRISLDTKNGGYIVYDANGEIEDSGFKSMKSAKNFVDSLAGTTADDVTSSDEFDFIDRSGSDEDIELAAIAYNLGVSLSEARKLHPTLSESKIKEYVEYYHLRHLPLGKRVKQFNGTLDKVNASVYPKHHSKIYKGYKIIVDPAGDGYNVYNTSGDLEDEGIGTMREAEELVNSLVMNSDDVTSSTDTGSRPISFQCPVCHSLAVHSTEKSIYKLADVDHDELFVCDECCSEMFARISYGGEIKFQVHTAPSDTDWDTVESASNNPRVTEREEYCPHCTNLSLVGAGDGRAVCDSCGAEYQVAYKNGKVVKSEMISASSRLYTRSYQNDAGDVISIWEENGVEFGEGGPVGDTFRGKWTPNLERYYTGLGFTEVISAATTDDVSFHDLVSEIFQAVRNKVKEVMMSYEFGFHEDEVDEYSTVNQEFRDNGQFCVFEIRAEVDYDGLVEFANQIDPIIQYYDPNAYFEPVTSGITEAYLSCETLRKFDENTKITSSTAVDDTVCRYKVEYYMNNNEERLVDYFYVDSDEEAEEALIEAVGPECTITGLIPETVPSWYRDADNTQDVNSVSASIRSDDPYGVSDVKKLINGKAPQWWWNRKEIEMDFGDGEKLAQYLKNKNVDVYYVEDDEMWYIPKEYHWTDCYFYPYDYCADTPITGSTSSVKTIHFSGYDVENVDGTFYVYLEDDPENEVIYEASSTESLDNFCAGLGEAWRKKYSKSVNSANYGGAYDVDPHQYFTRDDIVDFGEYVCNHLNEIFYDTFTVYDVYIVDYSRLVLEVMRTSDESIFSCNVKIDMRKVRRPSDLKDKFWGTAVAALRSEIESLDQDISSCDTIEAAYDDLPPESDMGDEVELEAELEFDLDTLIIVDDDGNFEYEDTTCPWIASEADSNGDFYEPEYDVYITDVNSVIETVSDMLVTMAPIKPGRYHVTGKVKLVYNISEVYEKRTYFKEYAGQGEYTDDYDREIYSDQSEVDFLMDKSYIKNFEYEPW